MKKSKKAAIIRSFVSYYRYDVPTFVADMLCAFVYAVGGLCYPMLSRPILNTYIPNGDTKHIIIFCAALLGVYIVRTLTDYFVCYYGHSMGVRMQARMRTDLFAHLQRLPYSYYDNTET
ncbi:MAG: ABC transporter ATP-binding protein, partial [Clostridia bacterium]|nr:ABC transporter ATP-binding protein [Clostridia bacterium]